MDLYLIRHLATESTKTGAFYGSTDLALASHLDPIARGEMLDETRFALFEFFETTRVLSIVENVPKEFLFYFSREATMQSDESQATNEVELNVSEIMKGLVEVQKLLK